MLTFTATPKVNAVDIALAHPTMTTGIKTNLNNHFYRIVDHGVLLQEGRKDYHEDRWR